MSDITLLTLLVTFPLMGVFAVTCIGLLVMQKLRLQTRLDDCSWWLIKYSDITIIRESRVRPGRLPPPVVVHRLDSFQSICSLQGVYGLSLSNVASRNGSSSSQSNFSSRSYGLKDKMGKENIFTTIGLYQVSASRMKRHTKNKGVFTGVDLLQNRC